MFSKLSLLVSVLCISFSAVSGQDGCVSVYSDFRACLNENSCDCRLIGAPSNPFQNGFCGAASDAVCAANGCCSPCEAEYQDYEVCVADVVSTLTFDQCQIDCDGVTDDAIENHAPTASPEDSPVDGDFGNCLQLLIPVASCAVANQESCAGCSVVDPPDRPLDYDFCDSITKSTCGIVDCCKECQEQLGDYGDCVRNSVVESTNGECEIDCSTIITKPPTSNKQTPAPSPMPTRFPSAAPLSVSPVSAAPVSAAPVSVVPVSVAPVSAAPVSAAPVSAAPVSAAPVSVALVSVAPVSVAPVSAAPVTSAPVTPSLTGPDSISSVLNQVELEEQPTSGSSKTRPAAFVISSLIGLLFNIC